MKGRPPSFEGVAGSRKTLSIDRSGHWSQHVLKHSIKQTIHQAHHQSNQTVSKERKQTSPKKKPYIKNFATPDRPPPAAVMLISPTSCQNFLSPPVHRDTSEKPRVRTSIVIK